jgi:hypothetical protein
MQSINLEETSNPPSPSTPKTIPEKTSFIQKNKKLLVVLGTILIVLIIIAVVLAVVLTTNKKKSTTIAPDITSTTAPQISSTANQVVEKPTSRLDCLPWLKNKPNSNLEQTCRQMNGCKYQAVVGNVDLPSCFYDTNLLKQSILSREDTQLGKSFTIASNNMTKSSDSNILRVDFEYLDDFALRIKVCYFKITTLLQLKVS